MITIWVPKRLVEIDLYNVAAQSPAALAEMSEKSYRQRVAYAAQKIRDSRAKIVMLTGPSASGKTTSAHKVAEALEPPAPRPMSSVWITSSRALSITPACPTVRWTTRTPTRWICPSSASASAI